MWFQGKDKDGMKHPTFYNPFPTVALALVLTAVCHFLWSSKVKLIILQIENCIDEWASGTFVSIHFSQDAYEKVYKEHLDELGRFDKFTKKLNILTIIQVDLYDVGWCVLAFFTL